MSLNFLKTATLIRGIGGTVDNLTQNYGVRAVSCVQCLHNQSFDEKFKANLRTDNLYHFNNLWCNGRKKLLHNAHSHHQLYKTPYYGVQWRPPFQGNSLLKSDNVVNISPQRELIVTPKAILDASPKFFQPYLRLIRFDKPIGTWLLFWPCTWSIGLAAVPGHFPDLWLLTLFGAGSFFMRGAGCIVNDIWDRDYDKKVERTKLRPLASGELSLFQGLCCLGGMLSISLCILLQLNWYSVALGAASMILVVMYPLAKRVTFWPQAMLGVTLNWGVLLAWSAIHGSLQAPVLSLYMACVFYTMIYDSIYSHQIFTLMTYLLLALTFNYGTMLGWAAVNGGIDWTIVLPLYISCMAWTLSYDTIYAHQDKYDDMLIGVKSTALKFGDNTKPWLSGFGTIMIGGLTYTGIACDQTWPYFCGVAFTAAHLAHQLYTVDLNNADDCAAKFRSNTGLGLVMFLGIVLGTLLKEKKTENNKS